MDKQASKEFPEEMKKVLRDTFKQLRDKVLIEVFTGKESTRYTEAATEIIKVFSELTEEIEPKFYALDSAEAKQRGITRSPAILISPDKYRIRYIGAPLGEEARTLIMAIVIASTSGSILSDAALGRLFELKDPRRIQVFVTPTCPYCPQQALNAISAAVALPGLITAETIEMYENRDFIDKYHIVTVPFTVINEVPIGAGVRPGELFAEEVLTLAPADRVSAPLSGDIVELDMVIIGGGPAGLTAGLYAGRSGLKNVVLEKATVGGQVLITPVVENYPGFSRIAGRTLVDIMYQQALQYTRISEGEDVIDIKKSDDIFELKTNRRTYRAKGIIIATGAGHRELKIPGERTFYGRGVSYCATCDGYFFKDGRKVVVVGGGNTAVTEALYLHSIGADVSLVHRKDTLRAEAFLRKSLEDRNVPVLWNSVIKEINGDDTVNRIKLQNLKDKSIKEADVEGVFIAVGYTPNNDIAKMLGLKLDRGGYIKADGKQRTSVRMVYAAGDVTGGIKQIATAVGQGAVAAITAFEDLESPYWKKKE